MLYEVITLYPNGKHAMEMKQIAQNKGGADHRFGERTAAERGQPSADPGRRSGGPVGNDPNLALTLAEGLVGQEKWDEAYKQYHSIIEIGDSPALGKAYAGAGRCLYEQQEYVRCIQLLSVYIGKDPKTLQLAQILMYMGLCYKAMEQDEKAKAFFGKALSMATPDLVPQIKQLYAECGG